MKLKILKKARAIIKKEVKELTPVVRDVLIKEVLPELEKAAIASLEAYIDKEMEKLTK